MDPYTLKVLIGLGLNARPLEGRDLRELLEIGVVDASERGQLVAVMEKTELCRLTGLNPRTIDRRCGDLVERGCGCSGRPDRG